MHLPLTGTADRSSSRSSSPCSSKSCRIEVMLIQGWTISLADIRTKHMIEVAPRPWSPKQPWIAPSSGQLVSSRVVTLIQTLSDQPSGARRYVRLTANEDIDEGQPGSPGMDETA